MTKPKIHYQQPRRPKGKNICNVLLSPHSEVTTELDRVTCQRCLRLAMGQKNGRPSRGLEEIQITASLPPEVLEWLKGRNKSETVREALLAMMAAE